MLTKGQEDADELWESAQAGAANRGLEYNPVTGKFQKRLAGEFSGEGYTVEEMARIHNADNYFYQSADGGINVRGIRSQKGEYSKAMKEIELELNPEAERSIFGRAVDRFLNPIFAATEFIINKSKFSATYNNAKNEVQMVLIAKGKVGKEITKPIVDDTIKLIGKEIEDVNKQKNDEMDALYEEEYSLIRTHGHLDQDKMDDIRKRIAEAENEYSTKLATLSSAEGRILNLQTKLDSSDQSFVIGDSYSDIENALNLVSSESLLKKRSAIQQEAMSARIFVSNYYLIKTLEMGGRADNTSAPSWFINFVAKGLKKTSALELFYQYQEERKKNKAIGLRN